MNRSTILLFGLGAQVILAVVFMARAVGDIQTDLRTRSESALIARNISWAEVDVSGRDITLTGLAPTDKQRERAVATIAAISGVRRVREEFEVMSTGETAPPPELTAETLMEEIDRSPLDLGLSVPYEFRVRRDGSLTALEGFAPDTDARESLMGLAQQAFGRDRVVDRLRIDADAPDGFLFAATQAISMAELVRDGAVGVRGSEIFAEGVTASDRDLARLREAIDTAAPDGFTTSAQLGSRQELEAVLRTNPDLAARVGPLPGRSAQSVPTDQRREPAAAEPTQVARVIDRSAEAAERCQARFEELLAAERIAFATASSDIDSSSQALLDQLVEVAKGCPATRIEIAGHTDDQGRESKNLRLSQARAESVMAYMVRNGVDLGRLSAVGYGETRPLVPNRTFEDRARNRRIEFRITQ